MSRSDGMKVSGKMKIDLIHREHLGISSSGSSSFHSEARTERRLTQGDNRLLPYFIKSQCKTDRHGSFADTRFCSCNGSDQYKIAFLYLLFINQLFGYLCNVATVIFHFITRDSDTFSNLLHFLQLNAASYFYV